MSLTSTRTDLAALLASAFVDHKEWAIVDHLPDSVAPPCAIMGWAEPWLSPSTMCVWRSRIEIMCVAQRIEPGGKLETLEEMISLIIPKLKRTDYTVEDVTSPFPLQVGGVDYLAASININYEQGELTNG